MKYFDALKRKKVYLSTNTKEFNIEFKSEDYINLAIEEQLPFLEGLLNEQFKSIDDLAYGNRIKINVFDEGENILDDKEVFGLMSNIVVLYSKLFKKQVQYVSSPKQKLLEELPISPFVSHVFMSTFIVNKPLQVVVVRNHEESGSYEEVELI